MTSAWAAACRSTACSPWALQEMLDPSVGEGVVAAMKKEVHRMELAELAWDAMLIGHVRTE